MAATAREYYVYQLIDPRNGKPFYVGKGKKNRIEVHERSARHGDEHPKSILIREIEAQGFSVTKEVIKRFISEDAAYNYEKRFIKKLGIENLTNIASGGRCGWSIKAKVQDRIATSISAFSILFHKTGCRPTMFRFGGEKHEIGTEFFEKAAQTISNFAKERGREWVIREFKKHSVIIQFHTKVDGHVAD